MRDDGVGIPADRPRRRASDAVESGLGLMTMRERVAELGSALRVENASGGGMIVEASIPLDGERRLLATQPWPKRLGCIPMWC